MWNSKAHLILFLGVQLLLVSSSNGAFGLGSLATELISGFQTNVRSALGAVKNTSDVARNVGDHVLHPIETVKNSSVGEIAQDVGGEVLRPIESSIDAAKNTTAGEIAMDIGDHVLHPIETVKNLSEVVLTTNVFTRNNQTLNCLGIPIKFFADAIEKIFTQTTSAKDVRFYFASRRQPDYVTVRVGKEFTLRGTDFNISRPTVVISHGFLSSGKDSWLKRMKDALLRLDDLNVIVVDWQEGSNTWNYYSASISTRIVGQQIATLFAQIREQELAKSSSSDVNNWGALYFIGHSLGSHIVAHAAFIIKESQREAANSWIVSRITGLDPAQPCFRTANLTLKLDKDDATYVDVIHTNARHILFLGLGLPDQLGFVDFYPNGGDLQPGCLDIDTSIWSFILLPQKLLQEIICSHGRSHAFLIESIENAVADNCSFIGYQWDRTIKREPRRLKDICNAGLCTEMGVNSASYYPDNPGIYYVPTAESAPFCAHYEDHEKLVKQNSNNKGLFAAVAKTLFQ